MVGAHEVREKTCPLALASIILTGPASATLAPNRTAPADATVLTIQLLTDGSRVARIGMGPQSQRVATNGERHLIHRTAAIGPSFLRNGRRKIAGDGPRLGTGTRGRPADSKV